MSELYSNKRSFLSKQQPNSLILRPYQPSNQQPPQQPINTFKKQMLSKLHLDQCFNFKLDSKLNNQNKSTELISQRKRANAEMIVKKKFCLPEIQNLKKQDQFKSEFRQLKLQSKRMLDRVNQLYQILKSDSNEKPGKQFRVGKTLGKAENLNPEQGAITTRVRNKTVDSHKQMSIISPLSVEVVKKSSRGIYTKRRYSDRRSTEESPQQSALLFTFYPKHQQINQFLS